MTLNLFLQVVGGKYADKHVPAHLRHLLAAESGCNDGAAFPFLFIALYLVIDQTDGRAIEDWFLITWLCESSCLTCQLVFYPSR
jgi:NhaP-type Na+/H+ or K+/H+ antiporter